MLLLLRGSVRVVTLVHIRHSHLVRVKVMPIGAIMPASSRRSISICRRRSSSMVSMLLLLLLPSIHAGRVHPESPLLSQTTVSSVSSRTIIGACAISFLMRSHQIHEGVIGRGCC